MNIRDRRAIRQAAADALNTNSPNPKRVVLIYTAVCCVLSLLSGTLSVVLNNQIANTGGLQNMGLRSILTTIQSVFPMVSAIVTFCLDFGYHFAVLGFARRQYSHPRTLLEGFRHFGPLLRAYLLMGLIYMAMGFVSVYLSSYIFILSPFSGEFYEIVMPTLSSTSILNSQFTLDEATLTSAMDAMMPMMYIFAGVFLLLFIPISYRFRMVTFALADEPGMGAMAAMKKSVSMMKKNCTALFRLDLSLWWYYGLQILLTVVCYGDVLLPLMGVTLPWSTTVSYFVFFILSLAGQILVYYCFMNRVSVTYAVAYEALQPPKQPKEVVLGNIFQM